jgi:hypothetical protein
MKIPLGLGAYESASMPFSAQRCVNMYASIAQDQAWSDAVLFGTPGVVQMGTAGSLSTDASRGSTKMGGIYYVVNGTDLNTFSSAGTKTTLGTVAGSARVSMAHNGDKLCIVVPGGKAYVYIASTSTFAEITDTDYKASDSVVFSDGYYIFTESDGTNWFVSNLNDPTSIDPLDFGSAELSPDKIVCGFANYDNVFILGETTIEPFQNIGGAGFPYQRIEGASYEKGCTAKYTPIQWEGAFYFVGAGKNERTSIYRAGGSGEPEKMSTDAIDTEIQNFTAAEISNAYSFTFGINGHSFVGFTFRSIVVTSRTFVFNVTASALSGRRVWFELQSGVDENAWRVASIDFVYDMLVVSDSEDGRIGYLDEDVFTEYGDVLLSEKVTPPVFAEGSSTIFDSLELIIDAGQGLITGQGSDPQIMMDFSDDGGRTWSYELWADLGEIGEYFRQVEWRRLGLTRQTRIARFRISDPIQRTFIKLDGNLNNAAA